MQDSKVIEIQGVFVGAAIRLPGPHGWRLVAADPRLVAIDGSIADTLAELHSLAHRTLLAARVPSIIPLANGAAAILA